MQNSDLSQRTRSQRRQLLNVRRDSHNNCSSCGRRFQKGDTGHLGYDKQEVPLYVGDCCAAKISDKVLQEPWGDWGYEIPDKSTPLWRYMDYSKLVAMLQDSALYFPRIDLLDDPFEYAQGLLKDKERWQAERLSEEREVWRNEAKKGNISDAEVEQMAMASVRLDSDQSELERQNIYVSCWHKNDTESETHWRLYCPQSSSGQSSSGVAIKTTVAALQNALDDDPDIFIGQVEYIDPAKSKIPQTGRQFIKPRWLKHDEEIRAVISRRVGASVAISPGVGGYTDIPIKTISLPGILKPVKLSLLIEEVVVSPFAPTWFGAVLRKTLDAYAVDRPVKSSMLLEKPF